MLLRPITILLSMASILGNTTDNITDASYSTAVDATLPLLSQTSAGNTAENYDVSTTISSHTGAVNATLNRTSGASILRDKCHRFPKFFCPSSGYCIYSRWRCDGIYDCLFNEDELGCPESTSTFNSTVASATTLSSRDSCESQGNFYCASSDLCVHILQRCDGVLYCYYGEDEDGCSTSAPAPTTASSSSCGGTLYRSGYVQSPNFPSNYDNNLRCNWTLIANPPNGSVVLEVYAFDTELSDRLSIYNSNRTLISRYTGVIIPYTFFLGSTAFITFTSDSSDTYSGFSIWFTTSALSPRESCERQGNFFCALSDRCVPMSYRCNGYPFCEYWEDETECSTTAPPTTTASPACGGTLYGSGFVRSPNYPSDYDNNLRCNWTLIANPYNGNIVLQLYAFYTEPCCDFVSIYSSNGTLLYRHSGLITTEALQNNYYPGTFVLGQTALITFTSDRQVAYSGFSMGFSTSVPPVPSTTLSPRNSCERQEKFYCASSDLCVPMSQRCNGYPYCYYGEDEDECSTTPPAPTSAPSSCGGTLYGSGFVRSPKYPLSYDPFLRCNWTLIAIPYNGSVVLNMYSFNTESCCDFVTLYNSNRTIVNQYSGTSFPHTINLGNTAVIIFSTDGTGSSSGFLIWFSTLGASSTTPSRRERCEGEGSFYCVSSDLCVAMSERCNGYPYCYYGEDEAGCVSSAPAPLNATSLPCSYVLYGSGYIRSPNYPSSYDNDLRCDWTLNANPYDGYIVLQFYAFSIGDGNDFLAFYNSSGTFVYRYSARSIPSTIVLRNTAVVTFNTDSFGVSAGFSIWFSTSGSSVAPIATLSPRDSCELQGYFYCAFSYLCIASWRRCDGYSYCSFGEDEAGCNGSSTSHTPLINPSQRDSCLGQGKFYCEVSQECILLRSCCDGHPDCNYGEDESGCSSRPDSSRSSASDRPLGSFIAVPGFVQVFLQLSKASASGLPRRDLIVISGYVIALLLRLFLALVSIKMAFVSNNRLPFLA